MKFSDLKKELKNKERTIDDLARYIGNTRDNNPNYSLFLGAGCSVTSGIRSGGILVEEWRKEIFTNYYKDIQYEIEIAKNKLASEHSSWYDPRNEYSSFFEKKYDLPRQRRMFVESEVSDKKPSVGYAYLVKLMEHYFFNAVFTTNFDDLLNEAFYIFSNQRPITCAHDSAITSITVTSKRPKIIKLHGDFLFDDIKSTIRETESLENNMKNKFIEFSKDYGMVVLGYGGYDRSVIDVFNFLLKNEDYFKNGLYWCLRKTDEVGSELHKLLWKDRVYFVEIEGFDEFFSTLNKKIQPHVSPIDSTILTNKGELLLKTIRKSIEQFNISSETILADIEAVEKRIEQEQFNLFFKQTGSSEFENKNISRRFNAKKNFLLFNLSVLLEIGNFDEFIKQIESINENELHDSGFQKEILQLKTDYYVAIGENDSAISNLKKMYDNYGKNPEFLCKAAALCSDNQNVLFNELIEKAKERDAFYYRSHFQKANYLVSNKPTMAELSSQLIDEICALYEKSLEVAPSLSNPTWTFYFDFLLSISEPNKVNDKCNELLLKAKKMDPVDIYCIEMELSKISHEKIGDYKSVALSFFEDAIGKTFGKNLYSLKKMRLDWLVDNSKIDKFEEYLKDYKSAYRMDSDAIISEATYHGKCLGDFSKGISVLEKYCETYFAKNVYRKLVYYYCIVKNISAAETIKSKYFKNDFDIVNAIHSANKQWNKIVQYYEKSFNSNSLEDAIEYSFSLIKIGDFEKAKNLLKSILDTYGWRNKFTCVLVINHEICCKNIKSKVNEERLNDMLNIGDKEVQVAAEFLLSKNLNDTHYKNAINLLTEVIKNDYERKETIKTWVIFDEHTPSVLL